MACIPLPILPILPFLPILHLLSLAPPCLSRAPVPPCRCAPSSKSVPLCRRAPVPLAAASAAAHSIKDLV